MRQPKLQPERQPESAPAVGAKEVSSPPANPGTSTGNPGDEESARPPAMTRLLALQEEMEREKETAVREVMAEKARLTEVYQAEIAKLDALLAKIAPEMLVPTPATPVAPIQLSQRVRARAEALAAAVGRPESSAKWNGQKFCPYCQIQGHDGRAHRGQPVPGKWSKAELAAYGYLPPANQQQLPANYDQIPGRGAI